MFSIIPVGIFALMNLLKSRGFSVKGINMGIERTLNPIYDLREDLKNTDYDLLILDLHWYEHSYGAIEIAKISKELYPEKPVIIGGFTTTIYAKEIKLIMKLT